ncbi:MAG: transrane efflux pump [Xanthobacteraceae bacterium]|jgi:cytochrome c-type biogenesis protein CcmH/NrfF|nr:transrane efflux pump [Xanthobacteraceae bacterium]
MTTANFLLLLIMPVGALVVGGIVYLVASRDHHPRTGPAE